jgi:hypothetical protein
LIQFFCGIGEREGVLLGSFANGEAEFLEIPAFKAILFRALPQMRLDNAWSNFLIAFALTHRPYLDHTTEANERRN